MIDASLLQLNQRVFNRDELDTMFKECMAIVNNTPLYEVSSDFNDPTPISHAHLMLLKDHPNPSPLESFTLSDFNSYGKLRWHRVQQLAEVFRHRWRTYYLSTLQSRDKWQKDRPNMCDGDLVLLKDKNAKRNQWNLAVIESVLPSTDGTVKCCWIRTSKGSYRRAVKHLVLLLFFLRWSNVIPRKIRIMFFLNFSLSSEYSDTLGVTYSSILVNIACLQAPKFFAF